MMTARDRWQFRFPLLYFIAAGLAAPGCSGSGDELPREAVSGTVTLDGQPLAKGAIQFNPVGGAGAVAAVGGGSKIEDGQFYIARENGLVPGTYNVSINAADRRDPAKPEMVGKGRGIPKELIPAKYNSQTTLKAEIKKGGTSDLKFELQSR
jgi:hypothetical protein